ncbi:hypothetical protein [Kitasatospora sp. NPDC008115]|uniref:hypothetical protein n=1 Tax=Kitasatospora sp. NPDC008115 TaxID=3364022 RepID=UPI0036F17192
MLRRRRPAQPAGARGRAGCDAAGRCGAMGTQTRPPQASARRLLGPVARTGPAGRARTAYSAGQYAPFPVQHAVRLRSAGQPAAQRGQSCCARLRRCAAGAEVLLTRQQFEHANEVRTAHGATPFADPRNGAADTLRAKDRPYRIEPTFFAYAAIGADDLDHAAPLERPPALRATTAAAHPVRCATPEEAQQRIEEIAALRSALPSGIDGVVVKADSAADQLRDVMIRAAVAEPRVHNTRRHPAGRLGNLGVLTDQRIFAYLGVAGFGSAGLPDGWDTEIADLIATHLVPPAASEVAAPGRHPPGPARAG